MKRVTSIVLASLLALAPLSPLSNARADGFPKIESGLYMPMGFTLGAAFGSDRPGGFMAGGEVSLAYLSTRSGVWGGVYGDAVYDFGLGGARWSFGPELGYSFFGLDGGLAVQNVNGRAEWGYQGRVVFTLAALAAFIRIGNFPHSETHKSTGEIGFLIKVPFPVWTEHTPRPHRTYEPPPAPPSKEEPKSPAPDPTSPPKEENPPPPIEPVPPPS